MHWPFAGCHSVSSLPDSWPRAGGRGTRAEIQNAALVSWLRDVRAQHKLSVCTGAALLAVAGLLQGRRATTNKLAFDWVASLTAAARAPGASAQSAGQCCPKS